MAGIDENAVDFIPTYNEEDEEPQVLPAGFPNLLANGSTGIAVGMATSIPPHNVAEICDAALHLIKTPKARIETLMQYVKGPDFPTGGIIIEPFDSMLEAYATGKADLKSGRGGNSKISGAANIRSLSRKSLIRFKNHD